MISKQVNKLLVFRSIAYFRFVSIKDILSYALPRLECYIEISESFGISLILISKSLYIISFLIYDYIVLDIIG